MASLFRPPLQHIDSECLQQLTGNTAQALIQALVQEDFDLFQSILSEAEPEDVNKFHDFPYYRTCLDVACEKGYDQCISLLLRSGADCNIKNPALKMYPLHIAVKNLQPECIRLLLRSNTDAKVRESIGGRNALHLLLNLWTEDTEEDTFYKCFDALISSTELDINDKDNDECTALEFAVRKKLTVIVHRLIVNLGAIVDENVQDAMQDFMPDALDQYRELINSQNASNNNIGNLDSAAFHRELFLAIRNGRLDLVNVMLEACRSGNNGVDLDSGSQSCTLLQQACLNPSGRVVKLLLDAGCDPNRTCSGDSRPPLVIAADLGEDSILRILLEHPKIDLNCVDNDRSKQTAAHKITQKLLIDKQKYLNCLQLLLESPKATGDGHQNFFFNINAQDVCGNTPLHYAAHSGVEEAVLDLLRHGSNFGIKNVIGEPAVSRILPATLESFLDECVHVNKEGWASRDFCITFKYSPLAPPLPVHPSPEIRTIRFNNQSNGSSVEQEVCIQDIQTKEDIYPESEALWHLSRSPEHQYLLKHPVVTSFLMLKWHKISEYFYVNFIIYTSAVLILTTYILLLHFYKDVQNPSYKDALNVFWYLLAICITILSIREIFQLGVAPLRYLFTWENYVEIGMIGCTAAVLSNSEDPSSRQHLSAIAVLLAWLEFLLLIGRHPRLSTFIAMFTTVSLTFLRLLLWYSVLFIGFGLSFFLVFQTSAPAPTSPEASAQEKNQSAFENIPSSIIKVLVMMTGELEFGDLPFDSNPVTSRIIFLSFLFLITIVLLNLLNGMAVSDTQAIQNKAETISYASRVDLISYMESMLLGDPFHFLADWPPFSWLGRCPSMNLVSRLMRGRSLRKFFKAERIILFYNCLPEKSYTVYPNRKAAYRNHKGEASEISCKCHAKFRLDNDIIRSACSRLQEKDKDQSVDLNKQIQLLRQEFRNLRDQQERLIRKLTKHS